MQSERTNDNSMIPIRTRCRVIGFINFIIFSVFVFSMITILILIIFNQEEEYITKIEKLPVKFIIIVIIVMIIAILFGLLYSNYKLMKKYTPSDGRAIKQWVFFQQAFIIFLGILFLLSLIFNHHHCLVHTISHIVFSVILLIELFIVREFQSQFESGAVNQPPSA